MTMGMPCVRCSGSGQVIEHACMSCKGEGLKSDPKQVSIKIPAGIRNQMELRLQAQGHCGTRGGRTGDLFVTVKVQPDEYFSIIDDDVCVDVPLSISDIVFGTTANVRQIDGKSEIKVMLAPGTAPGTTRTVRGKGPPRPSGSTGGSRGDMILKFSLKHQPAETLTPRQKELIREFDAIQQSVVAKLRSDK